MPDTCATGTMVFFFKIFCFCSLLIAFPVLDAIGRSLISQIGYTLDKNNDFVL